MDGRVGRPEPLLDCENIIMGPELDIEKEKRRLVKARQASVRSKRAVSLESQTRTLTDFTAAVCLVVCCAPPGFSPIVLWTSRT